MGQKSLTISMGWTRKRIEYITNLNGKRIELTNYDIAVVEYYLDVLLGVSA